MSNNQWNNNVMLLMFGWVAVYEYERYAALHAYLEANLGRGHRLGVKPFHF